MRILLLSLLFAIPANCLTLTVSWSKGENPGDVFSYVMLLSRDGGQSFSVEKEVPLGADAIVETSIQAYVGDRIVVMVEPKAENGVVGPRSIPSSVFEVPNLGQPGQPQIRGEIRLEFEPIVIPLGGE